MSLAILFNVDELLLVDDVLRPQCYTGLDSVNLVALAMGKQPQECSTNVGD